MSFVDGWVGLCSLTGPGAVTELAAAGYARQPVSFSLVAPAWSGEGASRALMPRATNSTFGFPYALANNATAPAGRAVWDAPVGGNLLLILPYGGGARTRPVELCEAGDLVLEGLAFVSTYSGQVASGATLGACYDKADIIGPRTPAVGEVQGPGGFVVVKNTGIITAGVALALNRGVLQSAASWAAL
jgi:hypothetical protein